LKRRANAAYVRKDPQRWKNSGWTSGPNAMIRDPDMPLHLVGAWMWLASHTEEFEVSGKVLYEAKNDLGRNKAYEYLNELERRGYLLRFHCFDSEAGVPYIQYDLQPWPVPEEERTWGEPRAKAKRRPHPGSKAARAAHEVVPSLVDNSVGTGQDEFPTGRESAGQDVFPEGRESAANRGFPKGRESGVDSRQAGSRQAGSPSKEEKNTSKDHSTRSVDQSGSSVVSGASDRETDRYPQIEQEKPSDEALGVVSDLDWPRRHPLRGSEAVELAALLDAAVASGRSWDVMTAHVSSALVKAHSNPFVYLRNALQPEQLPVVRPPRQLPLISSSAPPFEAGDPCGNCDARKGDPLSARVKLIPGTRELLINSEGKTVLCECHPAKRLASLSA
jgi:hypothetical protein